MLKKLIIGLFTLTWASSLYALPPKAPHVKLTQQADFLSFSWEKDDFADGYTLFYANYPDFSNLSSIDLGDVTAVSTADIQLPPNTALWLAVQAYNHDGGSDFSDILHVHQPAITPTLTAPQITAEKQGLGIHLSWTAVENATGYQLIYANSPDFRTGAQTLDVGTQTQISADLPNNTTLFIGVKAYNTETSSEISNIEYFRLNKRIVAIFPPATNASHESLTNGVNRAFTDFSNKLQGLGLETVYWQSDLQQLGTLLQGQPKAEGAETRRGYLDDEDILAFLTTATAPTLTVSNIATENPALLVSIRGTASLLTSYDNVLLLSPTNTTQAKKIYQLVDEVAQQKQGLFRYVTIIDDNLPTSTIYSFDLYLNLLRNAFNTESQLEQTDGIVNDNIAPLAQLVTTLTFDGTSENAQLIDTVLDVIQADAVIYLGGQFPALYAQHPEGRWLLSDSTNYNAQTFQSSDVALLLPQTAHEQNTSLSDYTYDAVGELSTIIHKIPAKSLNRSNIITGATALKAEGYQGITGEKRYTNGDPAGDYDLFRPLSTGWEKVTNWLSAQ
ncbi:hypothetical protein BegalDRAFT_2861 [Beggiatoa alba B18LD]|uniref:Fibronectin type-III domain-containing protein n=1 Tax=Beggiatoa alba B18LD TaxID=395493 RepID=I3CJA1_9GAMM|nr:hypothetical protein [Beggiatoa alba]EIJ43694.1 hypothetical protein BegalDRAFT_2861 [Beggiatoa alba B18LD]